ncbi:MAG: SoxR reducing system RseC family protein [Clostridiales bacterium]|nr:SoxR reducing system RseC family protein [Clostridiales bacterium]
MNGRGVVIEAAYVTAVSGRGRARLLLTPTAACTGCCAGCTGCGAGGPRSVWAENPIDACVGNRVLAVFGRRARRLRALLGALVPAALFGVGYGLCAACGVDGGRCTAAGCAAFLAGAALAARCLRRGGRLIPPCRIIEITDTDGKGNQP